MFQATSSCVWFHAVGFVGHDMPPSTSTTGEMAPAVGCGHADHGSEAPPLIRTSFILLWFPQLSINHILMHCNRPEGPSDSFNLRLHVPTAIILHRLHVKFLHRFLTDQTRQWIFKLRSNISTYSPCSPNMKFTNDIHIVANPKHYNRSIQTSWAQFHQKQILVQLRRENDWRYSAL